MTDERLFERLAAHPGPANVDPGFEDRLYGLLQQEMHRPERSSRPALLLVAALVAILMISAAVALGSDVIELPWLDRSPIPSPSAVPSESSAPSPTASAAAVEHPMLLRPETTTRSTYPPGEYWWDPESIMWMHDVTGNSPQVVISSCAPASGLCSQSIPAALETATAPTTAVIAGHEATYQQGIGADGWPTELWIVDIQGTEIKIAVVAEPGANDAKLAEAHAIIESIRSEPWETEVGFRLIFTLTEGWDSA